MFGTLFQECFFYWLVSQLERRAGPLIVVIGGRLGVVKGRARCDGLYCFWGCLHSFWEVSKEWRRGKVRRRTFKSQVWCMGMSEVVIRGVLRQNTWISRLGSP